MLVPVNPPVQVNVPPVQPVAERVILLPWQMVELVGWVMVGDGEVETVTVKTVLNGLIQPLLLVQVAV